MSATILSNIEFFEFEPDTITESSRDGITSFQFSIVGALSYINSYFQLDEILYSVPDQPPGNFRVVKRNVTHIASSQDGGLYRLQVVAEGGVGNSNLYILETSYQYQKEIVSGFVQLPTTDAVIVYACEWLSPTATITTNSASESIVDVQNRVRSFVSAQEVQIIRNKPATASVGRKQFPVIGAGIDVNKIIVVGSSVEKAGGLFRVRASATKGQMQASI